jgi:hypothetical protein
LLYDNLTIQQYNNITIQQYNNQTMQRLILNFSFLILMTPSVFFAQTAHKMLRKGDAEYLSKDYKAAEENYRKANETERTQKGSFNLGNTIYLQQRYDEAIKQ